MKTLKNKFKILSICLVLLSFNSTISCALEERIGMFFMYNDLSVCESFVNNNRILDTIKIYNDRLYSSDGNYYIKLSYSNPTEEYLISKSEDLKDNRGLKFDTIMKYNLEFFKQNFLNLNLYSKDGKLLCTINEIVQFKFQVKWLKGALVIIVNETNFDIIKPKIIVIDLNTLKFKEYLMSNINLQMEIK